MSAETKSDSEVEIAHVLFIDIVGYSKRPTNEQRAAVDELNEVVRTSEQLQKTEASHRLIKFQPAMGWRWSFTPVRKRLRNVLSKLVVRLKSTRACNFAWESTAARSAKLLMLRVEPISLALG